jgi:hypothetical protein
VDYKPGNLLREYSIDTKSKERLLVGAFIIISVTHSGVNAITVYDSDGFWKPATKTYFAHSDLKNKEHWQWEIQ